MAYKSLLKPVSPSKLPTNLRTLFVWSFSDIPWELNELLILFKNKLRAKKRSLNSGYNLKKNRIKSVIFQLIVYFREHKLIYLFFEGSNNLSNRWCTEVKNPKIWKRCIFQKGLCCICYICHRAVNFKSNYLCEKCIAGHNITICQKD